LIAVSLSGFSFVAIFFACLADFLAFLDFFAEEVGQQAAKHHGH
jgi:hypothetical protein